MPETWWSWFEPHGFLSLKLFLYFWIWLIYKTTLSLVSGFERHLIKWQRHPASTTEWANSTECFAISPKAEAAICLRHKSGSWRHSTSKGTAPKIFFVFYFSIVFTLPYIDGMVKYCNRAWEKCFFSHCFSKYLKNGWKYFDLKNWAKSWRYAVYKKSSKKWYFSRY